MLAATPANDIDVSIMQVHAPTAVCSEELQVDFNEELIVRASSFIEKQLCNE